VTPEAALRSLYSEHAARLYTYCLRVLGSPEAAAGALNETFAAARADLEGATEADCTEVALLRLARRACLSRLDQHAAGADVTIPPRGVEEQVRAANLLLPPRQREVLALREAEGLSYAEIGDVMDLHPNAVAQLAWRARLNLRGSMYEGPDFTLAGVPEDCERSLMLLTLRDDAPPDPEDRAWLEQHVSACPRCAASFGAMRAASATYQCWMPVVAAPVDVDGLLYGVDGVYAEPAPPPAAPSGGRGPSTAVLALGLLIVLAVAVGIFALARASTDGGIDRRAAAPPARSGVAAPSDTDAAASPGAPAGAASPARSRPAVGTPSASGSPRLTVATPRGRRTAVGVARRVRRSATSPDRGAARRRPSARRRVPAARRPSVPRRPAAPAPSGPAAPTTVAAAPPAEERQAVALAQPASAQQPEPLAAEQPASSPPPQQPPPQGGSCGGYAGNQGQGMGQGRPACPGNGNGRPQGPKA
jgi:DNA-directed RNA polymerase specialized sigma24 family protein